MNADATAQVYGISWRGYRRVSRTISPAHNSGAT